jgi:acyl dehydratase
VGGLYFEDLSVGQEIDAEWGRTLTETDNILFSSLTMNVQRLHVDAEYARGTEFGRPLMNSMFTLGLMVGMAVHNLTQGTTVANLGMTDVNFPRPLFAGDTITVKTVVTDLRDSRSRPADGVATFLHKAHNQHGELVAECRRVALMKRRNGATIGDQSVEKAAG